MFFPPFPMGLMHNSEIASKKVPLRQLLARNVSLSFKAPNQVFLNGQKKSIVEALNGTSLICLLLVISHVVTTYGLNQHLSHANKMILLLPHN